MNKPTPISYTSEQYGFTATAETPAQIVNEKGLRCLNGGRGLINGKMNRRLVSIDNKPELKAEVDAWLSEWAAYEAFKAAEFAANVPGYDALRKAQDAAEEEANRVARQFNRAMDNDGARLPKSEDASLRATARTLAAEYPRAAMYLRAQAYTEASNHNKSAAGRKAMAIIATGGSIEDALYTLEHWLPESAWNN